ncbi:MAG TPA: bifunctional (p)ppGpp synthetase/guanosine-3',5'-bis(diphosphate) 3'-pyrophosphohydrolase [Dehalococcoidia bacterium]|nr:bifunctional (p)ppGpp synthetase/guanosine-3',5'-bis(diphosphate) 3'-pyrophosphohydrolase [Dehalococcoidia bacterium]
MTVKNPESADTSALGQALLDRCAEYLPLKAQTLVKEALEFAMASHDGQKRKNGDPVITHPLHAADTIASLQLDAATIAGALLHDVQEDCGVSNPEIEKRFGPEVAVMVEGVTKLGQISGQADTGVGDKNMQAENLRKMFLAMAQDLRVVIIKLADRLHNMRTLWALDADRQQRIARETMEIYAPLAARLGIWEIKWQLEDLAFRYLEPDTYKRVAQMLEVKREVRERYVADVTETIKTELAKHGIEADVQGRAKHIYSIYKKMEKYADERRNVDEIYDLLAVRVMVGTEAECYQALGVVHSMWRPLPGTFDDYIANPKESMYQSLHTTVMALNHQPLEVQIRTAEMHQSAEYGIAAHWRYKEGSKRDVRYEERLAWIRQLMDWQREISQAEELVEAIKTDIFQDQVFIFTPRGEIKDLPTGATPLDFAYRIHTDLGHLCVGAKVNGKLVPLNYSLKNGEVVEILTSKSSKGPSRDWMNQNLGYLKTTHAREKVRAWFKKQERAENIIRGKEMLEKELARLGTSMSEMQAELQKIFKYDDLEDFFLRIGYGEISTQHIANKIAALIQEEEEVQQIEAPQKQTYTTSIQVLGTGDLLTRLSRCCNPVPGDAIIGYVTRGEGVSIHRSDCPNVLHLAETERLVDVEWGRRGQMYPVAVHIEAWDRVGLLRDVATMVAEEKVNMVGVHTQEREDGHITIYMTLETTGVEQLSRMLNKLEGVRGVLSVSRRIEGGARKSA